MLPSVATPSSGLLQPSIMIRSAHRADIPGMLPMIVKICTLHRSWDIARYNFVDNIEELCREWLEEILDDSRNLGLVAEDRANPGVLVGVTIGTVERETPIFHLQEYGFIHDVWVEEPYRRMGVAQQMLQEAIAHFKQVGMPQIRLSTAIVNESARRLYMASGFRVSTAEMLMELE